METTTTAMAAGVAVGVYVVLQLATKLITNKRNGGSANGCRLSTKMVEEHCERLATLEADLRNMAVMLVDIKARIAAMNTQMDNLK